MKKFPIFYNDQGENASKAFEKIRVVCGEIALSKSAACKYFVTFRSGNFDVRRI